jgi:hypothetical protein
LKIREIFAQFSAMSLKPVIDDIADQADDFLDGVTTRADARAAISEQITIMYPTLTGSERAKVIEGVILVLEDEGFFDLGSSSAEEAEGNTDIDGV